MPVRVFVVEDNAIIRENLADALRELAPVEIVGYAEDEPSAIEWLRQHEREVDLLIIDIFLNRGSGLGVLRYENSASMYKVVLSNYATDEMRRKCLSLGADRVFDKSKEFDALVEYCARLEGELS
jgi:DNA-binding NarL/FixJ family response regulator